MALLKDDELVLLVTGKNPIVTGLPQPPSLPSPDANTAAPNPWYGKDSAIQASSIDLHIGAIFVPNADDKTSGSVANPKVDLAVQLGQTVVIVSLEELNLPKNIAAFGFPPARLSSRGLLMTNPGHVDPGFKGPLRFTVMNIAKENITLRKGDPIVTLLVFQLTGDATAGFAERNNLTKAVPGPTQDKVNCLSLDFLDVSTRADAAAVKAVANAEVRAKFWGTVVPAWSALATVIGALLAGAIALWQPMNQIKKDLEQVTRVLEMKENKSRLDKFDEMEKLQQRVIELETALKGKGVDKPGGNKR